MVDNEEILRRPRTAEILRLLLDKDLHVRGLVETVGGSATTISARISDLSKAGLIVERRSKAKPYRRTLSLTPEGHRLAEIAIRTQSLIGEVPTSTPRIKVFSKLSYGEQSILALASGLGGTIRGSTRLQKYVFLLQKELGKKGIATFSFKPYSFGPFSKEVFDDLDRLQARGLILPEREVRDHTDEDGNLVVRKNWVLTPAGSVHGRELLLAATERQRSAIACLKKWEGKPLELLLAHVYETYPDESRGRSGSRPNHSGGP